MNFIQKIYVELLYFIAGDTTYTQQLLLNKLPDGISPNAARTLQTMQKIRDLAGLHPVVYLPTHDPDCENRLAKVNTVFEDHEKNKAAI